jgi:hypothetical protein
MLTGELARELGLTVKRLNQVARSLDVERRCGRLWWTPEVIERLKQELERRAEVLKTKSLYPRTPEVASRLGVGEGELRALIHEHGLPVEKDKTSNVYQWTDSAIAAAQALLEDLANRSPEPPAPPPPGMTSKEVAARLKMQYQSFIYFSLALRRSEASLQPVLHKGTLYWSQEDVAFLEKALGERRARPDLKQKHLIQSQKGRLAKLQEHACAIRENFRGTSTPQAISIRQRVQSILSLCEEIESALALPLAFINTLPVEGWSLRLPIPVWVRAVTGGFAAEAVDFDLRTTSPTRRGAIILLRHALFRRYQELARDPAQDEAAWLALRQLVVPPK